MIVQLLDKLIPRGTVQGQKGRVLNQIERIEAKKARDRMAVKKQGTDHGPEVKKGETRDIVGKASGFGSGRTYARAKYIYENADEETIKEVDEGKKSIRN
ncbi:hypothetical protein [Staphylococcus simulans]|uniref:hypothetical protein n=1 Tax=Staphylococcus simulans TaxID=1286 RepID=UPI001F3A90AB|nr:hypothetical protein [Staphylococcus simulans]